MKNFIKYLEYLLAVLIMKLARALPRGFSRWFARTAAHAGVRFPPFGGLIRKNLKAAFPELSDRERFRMSRECLASLTMTLLDFFRLESHPEEFESMYVTQPLCDETGRKFVSDREHPSILIAPHFGNWELSGMILALHFHAKVATVVRTPQNKYLDRLIASGRMVKGVQLIYSKGGMLKLFHALQNGYVAGMLIDQNTRVGEGGAFVNFFGLPCPVSQSPAVFARKLNANVAVGGSIRRPDGKYDAYLFPLSKRGAEYSSDLELTEEIMKVSEMLIRKAPEQYLWMYKRFQHIPPDCPEELRKRYPDYARVPDEGFFDSRRRHHCLAKK